MKSNFAKALYSAIAASSLFAAHPATAATSAEVSSTSVGKSTLDRVSDYIGITYFSFFDGPGLGEPLGNPPGYNGAPLDTGLGIWTNLSVRLKFSDRYALDYQLRLQQIFTNEAEFRNQGGRLGVSGTLLKGDNWSLTGALNSDLPGVGQIPTQRTLIANPGLFSQFAYRPSGSKWSVFSMVSPRVFIYEDSSAMALQDDASKLPPGAKPQIVLQVNPSINYAFNDRHGVRAGITFDVRKNAIGSFQRWWWPVDLGYTYSFSKRFNLYPHMRFSTPLDNGLRNDLAAAKGASAAPWTHTASVGIWLNGTLL